MGMLLTLAGKYILPNKLVLILALALSAGGFLLVQSYKANGAQREKVRILQSTNTALENAYNNRIDEIKALQIAQLKRRKQQEKIKKQLSNTQKKLASIPHDKTCIDTDLGDDFARVFSTTTQTHH